MSEDEMTHRDDIRLEEHRLHAGVVRDVLFEDFEVSDVIVDRTTLRETLLRDLRLRGVALERVDISGEVEQLVVNGVDVGPLVEAELVRRDADYGAMKPTDADGFRHAWDVLERRWASTVERARRLPAERLHESVDGEWSFTETLRHLCFATESWVGRVLEGDPSPWHALSLPWDGMPDTPGIPRDRAARPDLDTALALRADRTATVRRVLDGVTDEELDRVVTVPDGVGWPPAGTTMPVRHALGVVLTEEWWHRQYAERDLDALLDEGSVP